MRGTKTRPIAAAAAIIIIIIITGLPFRHRRNNCHGQSDEFGALRLNVVLLGHFGAPTPFVSMTARHQCN